MGREVRRVPPGWEHPRNARGHYIPMHGEGFPKALASWEEARAQFESKRPLDIHDNPYLGTFEEWAGQRPSPDDYVDFKGAEATAYQVYETVSEGTPTSPVFTTTGDL